jgi:hypothetical protein
VHSFNVPPDSQHENKKYYAVVKYNAGIVIAFGICLPFSPPFCALRSILVQMLLYFCPSGAPMAVIRFSAATCAVFCYHPATINLTTWQRL